MDSELTLSCGACRHHCGQASVGSVLPAFTAEQNSRQATVAIAVLKLSFSTTGSSRTGKVLVAVFVLLSPSLSQMMETLMHLKYVLERLYFDV